MSTSVQEVVSLGMLPCLGRTGARLPWSATTPVSRPPPVKTLDFLVGTGGGTLPTCALQFLNDDVTAGPLPDHPGRGEFTGR